MGRGRVDWEKREGEGERWTSVERGVACNIVGLFMRMDVVRFADGCYAAFLHDDNIHVHTLPLLGPGLASMIGWLGPP